MMFFTFENEPIMKRADAIRLIESHAAQGDDRAALRIYVENRVRFQAFNEAMKRGRRFGEFVRARDAAKAAEAMI